MAACIYTDADNTLWDTDAVFREAQLGLLNDVENLSERSLSRSDRLEFLREYDQAIAFFQKLVRADPNDSRNFLGLGFSFLPWSFRGAQPAHGRQETRNPGST